MLIEIIIVAVSLVFATMLIAIIGLTLRNKDLEIETARLKKQIELEAMRGELHLAKFQIPKK